MKGQKKPQNLPSNYVTLVQLEERWRIKQNELESHRPSNYLTLAQLQERWEQRHQKDKQQQEQHEQQQQGDEKQKPRQKQEERNVDNRRNYPRRKNRNSSECSFRARPEENDAVEVVQGHQKDEQQQGQQEQQQKGDEKQKPRQKQEERNFDNRRNNPRRKNRNFPECSFRARPEKNDAVEVVQGHQKDEQQQEQQEQQQQGDEKQKPRQKQEERNVDNRQNYPSRKNRNLAESSFRARPEENDAVEVFQGKNEDDAAVVVAAVAVTVEGNESGNDNMKEKSKHLVQKRNNKKKDWEKKKEQRREKDKMIKDGEVRAQEQGEVIKSPKEEYVPVKRNEIRRDVTPDFKPKIDSVVEIEPKLGAHSLGEENQMSSETQNRTVNRSDSGYRDYKSRYNGYNRSNFGHRGNHGGFSGRDGLYRGGPTKVNDFMRKDSRMVWVKKGEVANGAEDTRDSKELE